MLRAVAAVSSEVDAVTKPSSADEDAAAAARSGEQTFSAVPMPALKYSAVVSVLLDVF